MSNLPTIVNPQWSEVFPTEELQRLKLGLHKLRDYYPSSDKIFAAFQVSYPPSCVIIGQDPYPQRGLATGVAFAVPKGKTSPSLKIIFEEAGKDNLKFIPDVTLTSWMYQNVLLLNSALTVRPNKANDVAHRELWKIFITKLIVNISSDVAIPWMLWGDKARQFKPAIMRGPVFEAVHPVYDHRTGERRFRGCDHFNKVNNWLKENDREVIQW